MEKKHRKIYIFLASIVVLCTVAFTLAYDQDTKAKPLPESSLDASTGKATGRFVWLTYGELEPPEQANAENSEVVRFVTADQESSNNSSSDIATIAAAAPDFIALQNAQAPAGEGLSNYKATKGLVFWRDARWTLVAEGQERLNKATLATWATVESKTTKRKVSIISTSFTTLNPKTVESLSKLSAALEGEVIIGVSSQIAYEDPQWPAKAVEANNLALTYDFFSTFGGGTVAAAEATMDAMMFYKNTTIVPLKQGKWTQVASHDALWSEWELTESLQPMSEAEQATLVLAPAEGNIAY